MKQWILQVLGCVLVGSMCMVVSAATYPWHDDFDGGLGPEWVNGRNDPSLGAPAPGNRPAGCYGGNISSGSCADGVGRLLDAGGGDMVYYSENWAFVSCRGMVGLRGTVPYDRADGPYAIAELFIISAAPEGGESNGGAAGVFGAWHTDPGVPGWGGPYTGDVADCPSSSSGLEYDMELGTHHWPGWKLTYVDGPPGTLTCGPSSGCPELQTAGGLREISRPNVGSLSKPHSSGSDDTVANQVATGTWFQRWELGLIQFASSYDPDTDTANGGAGWVTIKDSGGTEIDTRNTGGEAGTAATVYLGFGGFKHFGLANVWVGNSATPVPVELSEWELE